MSNPPWQGRRCNVPNRNRSFLWYGFASAVVWKGPPRGVIAVLTAKPCNRALPHIQETPKFWKTSINMELFWFFSNLRRRKEFLSSRCSGLILNNQSGEQFRQIKFDSLSVALELVAKVQILTSAYRWKMRHRCIVFVAILYWQLLNRCQWWKSRHRW